MMLKEKLADQINRVLGLYDKMSYIKQRQLAQQQKLKIAKHHTSTIDNKH